MANMVELFYGDKEPTWSLSTYHDYSDYNGYEVDAQYQYPNTASTRYMSPVMEIRCCSKCEERLQSALRNIHGVDSVRRNYSGQKLMIAGSADYDTIQQALKHVRGHHHHFLPTKIHNPFRRLISRHTTHNRHSPSWNQTANDDLYTTSTYNNTYNAHARSDDRWKYGGKYGPTYGEAPQNRYRPGSIRHALFDSHRPSNHSNDGYTHYCF